MHKAGQCAEKPAFGGGQVHDTMSQSMLLNEDALSSIERRTTRLEHGFVGAETTAVTDASDAVTETAAATDASATDTTDTQ